MSRLKSYGDSAFSVAAPTLWNKLPADIRNGSSLEIFQSVLKTHLFKVAFTDKELLSFKSLIGFFYRHIIWDIIIVHIICTVPMKGSC